MSWGKKEPEVVCHGLENLAMIPVGDWDLWVSDCDRDYNVSFWGLIGRKNHVEMLP